MYKNVWHIYFNVHSVLCMGGCDVWLYFDFIEIVGY